MIYALATRADIRKEVIYLASKSHSPSELDMKHVSKVFAYLHTTPDLGAIFDARQGAILYGYADASFNNHYNGRSQSLVKLNLTLFRYQLMQVNYLF